MWINIYTVRSNNKRDVARDEAQHRHDKLLISTEQAHATRSRLSAQKHEAFKILLAEVGATGEGYHRFLGAGVGGTYYPTSLRLAASQAKLLSTDESRIRIDAIVKAFSTSHFEKVVQAEEQLVEVLAVELK